MILPGMLLGKQQTDYFHIPISPEKTEAQSQTSKLSFLSPNQAQNHTNVLYMFQVTGPGFCLHKGMSTGCLLPKDVVEKCHGLD